MYIRRTLTRTLASGAQYYSHRLVRTERIGGRVRQVTLLNLGTDFSLGATQWQALCARIEDLLAGHVAPVGKADPPLVEAEAQRVAALLLARQSRAAPRDRERVLESVDLDTLELTSARSVGLEQVALWAIGDLRLAEQFHALDMPQRHSVAALGLIVGRMAGAGGARTTQAWWGERSALGEMLGIDLQAFAPKLLERAVEGLMTHRKALEGHLQVRVHELLGPPLAEPFYYLTNACLGLAAPDDASARRTPRAPYGAVSPATMGLLVDRRGFIQRSASCGAVVAPGKPLRRMLDGLGAAPGALVVTDGDAANADWLRANGYRHQYRGATVVETEPLGSADEALADLESVFASLRPGTASAAPVGEPCNACDLLIAVLACQCVQLIRHRLRAHGISAAWPTLRQILAGQSRVTVSVRRGDGRVLHVRQATRADCEQLAIFQALGIDPAPGGVQKTII